MVDLGGGRRDLAQDLSEFGDLVGVGGLVAHRCKPHDGAGLDESGLDGRDASLTGKSEKIGRFNVSYKFGSGHLRNNFLRTDEKLI